MGKKQISESLGYLEDLEGFLGAALVDARSGMVLGKIETGRANLEIAAAANTELVRAKTRALEQHGLGDVFEEVVISLGEHYHLLRAFEARPNAFLFLVLQREDANLALARMEIGEAVKAFRF